MPRMIGTGLSRREREILDVLNRLGSATGAEIESAMPDPPTNAAVRSILRILESKGHVRHEEQGKRYVYFPTTPRASAARTALREVVQTFFGGSLSTAVKAFLSDADAELSDEDLASLAEFVESARKHQPEIISIRKAQ